jgi:hypothetical protein
MDAARPVHDWRGGGTLVMTDTMSDGITGKTPSKNLSVELS